MDTRVDEISAGVYRLSTHVPEADFQFQPDSCSTVTSRLLFHTGPRRMFPLVAGAIGRASPSGDLRWITNGFCLTPNVTRGRSRGTVRLRSRDFRDRPRVDPRYFTDPEGHDMTVMLAGLRLARRIVDQPALREWIARELAPGPDVVTDGELADYVAKTHNTVYHPAGTARMGPASDPLAVLDPQLRVRGVDGLRVADASVLPFLPAVNPGITCLMVGEKAADLLRGCPSPAPA